jgi:hypothetical protein
VASPDIFMPVNTGTDHKKVTLVDALAVCANPGKKLLREAQRVFGEDAEVATILSIGAGRGDVWNITGNDMKEVIKRAVINCEPVHEDLYARLRETSIYFRLNVERGLGPQMELSSASVAAYLEEGVISDRLDEAIRSFHRRPTGVRLEDISGFSSRPNSNTHLFADSVTVIEVRLKPRPSLVENFIGREDILKSLHRTHVTDRSSRLRTPAITVLSGLGGAGKTQTALKFALEFEEL